MGDIQVEVFDVSYTSDGYTHTLTNAVDTDYAFVLNLHARRTTGGEAAAAGVSMAWDDFAGGVELTASDTLTFYRSASASQSAASDEVRMLGEVWRYTGSASGPNEFVSIWNGEVSISSGNSNNDQTISGVTDPDKVVCFVTGIETDTGTVSDGNGAVCRANLTSSTNLRVHRGHTTPNVVAHVHVVEFTGSDWSIGHFEKSSLSDSDAVTINDQYDIAGGTFDVGDWSTAFIWADMNAGTSTDDGLEDTWFVVEPAAATTQVQLSMDATSGRTGSVIHGYVIQNDNLSVERETASKSIPAGLDTSLTDPSNLSDSDESSLAESYVFTDGTGTAYARGAVGFKLNGTAVEAWVHRSGNAALYRYAGIDLTGLEGAASQSLTVEDSFHTHQAEDVTLSQKQSLTVEDSFHTHQAEDVTISQPAAFDGSPLTEGYWHTTFWGAAYWQEDFWQDYGEAVGSLTVQDSYHGHQAEDVALSQKQSLTVEDSFHTHQIEDAALSQKQSLTAEDAYHAHQVEDVTLSQKQSLVVEDSFHVHKSEDVTVINQVLTVEDSFHVHKADDVYLGGATDLIIEDSFHGHKSDDAALSQKQSLTVEDSFHVHESEDVILTQSQSLTVEDSFHVHQAADVTLSSGTTLIVEDSFHGVRSDEPTLINQVLTVEDAFHIFRGDAYLVPPPSEGSAYTHRRRKWVHREEWELLRGEFEDEELIMLLVD